MMQQQVLKCRYEICKVTLPSGQGAEVIEKMVEFQVPDGARIHSIVQVKENAIIGAPNTFLMLVESAQTFLVDVPETPHLSS